MNPQEITLKVWEILTEMGIASGEPTLDNPLTEMGIDSLDIIDIHYEIECEFDVDLEEKNHNTLREIVTDVHTKYVIAHELRSP